MNTGALESSKLAAVNDSRGASTSLYMFSVVEVWQRGVTTSHHVTTLILVVALVIPAAYSRRLIPQQWWHSLGGWVHPSGPRWSKTKLLNYTFFLLWTLNSTIFSFCYLELQILLIPWTPELNTFVFPVNSWTLPILILWTLKSNIYLTELLNSIILFWPS